jgi:hypothetical protein
VSGSERLGITELKMRVSSEIPDAFGSKVQEMSGVGWRFFDDFNRNIEFIPKSFCQRIGHLSIVLFEAENVVCKFGMKRNLHPSAERNCSSVNPTTRPAATSSIR